MSAAHCATRLRLIVRDKDAIGTERIEKIDLVKGTFFNAGQYQIILGTGIVNKVYAEIEAMGLSAVSKAEQDELIKGQQTGVKRVMRILGDIFVPIISVIAATVSSWDSRAWSSTTTCLASLARPRPSSPTTSSFSSTC